MKKYSLLMIPLMALAAFLGVSLSNADMVEAANNEVCGAETFRDKYLSKIDVSYDDNNVTITNNSGLNLTYTFYADGNTTTGTNGDFNDGASATFTIDNGGSVEFTLKEDMEEPCKSDAGTAIGNMQLNVDGRVTNPLYNQAICVNYRNKWGNNEIMTNAVSYCYSEKVYETYSQEVVQGWINTAEELYEAVNSSSGGEDITIDNTYQEVSDVKKTDKLVCNAFTTDNYDKMNKYYHIETNTENNCAVTCKEEIEVNFSDPVATQAGLCFQYLIEIKSRVECDAEYKAAPPVRKQVCYPSPVCINGGRGYDAGGPNEEFDQCVQECDGGNYSQKCVDKCYYEVYENKDTKKTKKKKVTHEDVKEASPLYMSNQSFYEVQKLAASCPGTGNATTLYNFMQADSRGHYSGGNWISEYGSGSICSLGPYYFRSLAQTQRTIGMWNGTVSYNRFNQYYRPNGNGIMRALHKNNTWCSDSCYWSGSCGGNTAYTEVQAQKEYEQAVEEYIKNKEACEKKEATCEDERTDYEIVVENKDNNDEKEEDYTESFNAYQNMNSSTVTDEWAGANNSTFGSMVKLVDGSCEDGEDDPWNYHNIITFPGTWLNNKTGRPVHTIEPGKEIYYTYVGNEYCTKLNSLPTNTAWYDWKVNQNGDASKLTEEEKQEIVTNIDYNIKGSIDNYGYFGWDFDIECFYAIGDETTTKCSPDDPDYPDCDDNKDNPENPASEDYKFRSVSLDTMFPSNDGSNNERSSGFNWTCEATNLENEDYPVQPIALKEQIEERGDSVYSDKYIDYEINLTAEDMDRIRKYNKDNSNDYAKPNYEDSDVNASQNNVNGITVYTSPFLTQLKSWGALVQRGLIGCNNQEGTGDGATCQGIIEDTKGCMREYNLESSILNPMKGAR